MCSRTLSFLSAKIETGIIILESEIVSFSGCFFVVFLYVEVIVPMFLLRIPAISLNFKLNSSLRYFTMISRPLSLLFLKRETGIKSWLFSTEGFFRIKSIIS